MSVHKFFLAGLIVLTLCATAVLSGCGAGASGAAVKREIPARGEPSDTVQDVNEIPGSDKAGETQSAVPADEGTIRSLDEIKQKALSEGYETSDLIEIQKTMAEGIADGFNILIAGSQNAVLEFETVKQAQTYAEYVNAAGAGAAILNGRFFTYLDAGEDGSTNADIQSALEALMDASALAGASIDLPETAGVTADTAEYKDAFALLTQIKEDMSALLDRSLEAYRQNLPEAEAQRAGEVMPLLFNSIELSFTAGFGENEASYAGIAAAAEMLGMTEVQVTRIEAHNYTLSGKTFGDKRSFEIQGIYDPATKGLRMLDKTDGVVTEFFEFIPLGDGLYAFQNGFERALAVYRDGKPESFIYTRIDGGGYSSGTDSIFPAGAAADVSWAAGPGEGVCAEYYAFDGRNIRLNVKTFGSRVTAEIPASIAAS